MTPALYDTVGYIFQTVRSCKLLLFSIFIIGSCLLLPFTQLCSIVPFIRSFYILFVWGHKELPKLLTIPQAKRRLVTRQTPQDVKQIIRSCGILPEAPPAVQNTNQRRLSGRKRCFICPRSKDKKCRYTCSRCHNASCEEHSKMFCNQCQE